MTACGCETGFGGGNGLQAPAPGACKPAPSGAAAFIETGEIR